MHVSRRLEGYQSPSGSLVQHTSSARSGCYMVVAAGLLLAVLWVLRPPQPDLPPPGACIMPAATETAAAEAPAVLAKMLVMVTFFWDINHLSFLTQVRVMGALLRSMHVFSSVC